MSEEGNKKLYAHYTALIEGKVKTKNLVRNDLIVSDAKRHLADLVKKNPNLESPTIEHPSEPEEPKAKSKRKR